MANKHKGEVELKAGDKTYILRFGWNEIAEVETILNVSFFEEITPKFQNPASIRAGEWRAMLWGALGGQKSGKSLHDAGEIMNEVGIEKVGTAIGQAVEVAFPVPEVAGNPRQASSAGTMPSPTS